MRNRLLASLMILAVLAGFTSCQDQSTAEDMTRTVSLALSNVDAEGSRTLRPDDVVAADTYYVSLTEMSGTNGNYSEKADSKNNIKATIENSEGKTTLTIKDVHIGLYRVDIYGTKDNTKVLTGTSGDNVLTVAPNGDNTIDIIMNQIYNEEGLKGTVEVPIDWSAATSLRVTKGFQIKAFDATKGGDPIATYTYTPGTGEKTSDTWKFEMGVTPSTLLRFDLYDADGAFINTLRRTYVWVASGTTSRFMDGEKGLTITNMTTQYAFNIYNFKAEEKDETSATLTWNIAGANNILKVNIWYTKDETRPTTEPLEITEGLAATTEYELTGLTAGDTYHVWYQAVYNNGMVSTIDEYDGTIRTVSYVTDIDITNADIKTKVGADPFTLSVSITPEKATNETYTYSYTDEAFTVSGDTFKPKKAGVYTIKATANGSKEANTVSDTIQVITHLATPTVTATATAQGIQLSGYADEDAESYDIYRNGSFLKNTKDTSYVDSDVATSTKYSYEVVAKLTIKETNLDSIKETNLDSDKSTATKEISIKNSVINITVANIESSMDIDISTSDQIYLQSGVTKSSVTFSYEAPSGYTTAWLLNGTAIPADEGSNNSRVTISLEKYENEFFSAEQTLTLVLTDGNGKSYSNGINFYYVLGNSTVTAISLSVDNDLIITNVSDKSARQIQINAAVSGTGAYINVPNYSIIEGSNIASINSKGVVTFNEGASGTVTVRATGIPTTTVTDEITLYAFSSADDMATALANSVNTVWGKAFAIADDSSHFNKDWFVYGASGARDSYDINATDIGGTSGSFYFRNANSIIADPSNYPEARIDSVTADISKFGSAALSSETISLDISTVSGTGPSGTSNMVLVGRTSTNNKVTIVLNNHNKASATINYNSVHVNNKTGNYTVAIPANVAVNQTSAISTTINNSSSITQVLTN